MAAVPFTNQEKGIVMKTAKGKKRILGRVLATELTLEELEKVAGCVIATNSCSRSLMGDDEDDCDERYYY